MIPRIASSKVQELAAEFPFVAIIGSRRSGKQQLARYSFPDKPYISLADPCICEHASTLPGDFLGKYPEGAVLDEVHRSAELLSHILRGANNEARKGLFILTGPIPCTLFQGSNIGILRLLPLSVSELTEAGMLPENIVELLYKGMYPELYVSPAPPSRWYPEYITSFLDRDVRRLINIRDLGNFQRFIRLCAAQTANMVNFSMLAKDCGITHNTARAWLSMLEASHLIYFLPPHHRSYNKRLVKTPKLYFHDTGLAAWLMGIQDIGLLESHPKKGALFETFVVGELMKGRINRGLPENLYFWRDNIGNEIDIIVEQANTLLPIEIRAETTLLDQHFKGMKKWLSLAGSEAGRGRLIYGGDDSQRRDEAAVVPWRDLDGLAMRL